ncbi:MAG TPA: CBS domain-containing protein [Actinomycetota bacterium]|jgi:CBS domain-containing protein|nr:CBS domain-containing protein [Actinomycetota bacterium]
MSPRAAWRLEALGFSEVYDYWPGKQDWFAAGLPSEGEVTSLPRIGGIARRDVPTCLPHETVAAARSRVEGTIFDRCLVVTERRIVQGQLRVGKELEADPERAAGEVMLPGPSTFRPNVSLREMAHFMDEHDFPRGAVTTSSGELIGEIRRDDVEGALAAAPDP